MLRVLFVDDCYEDYELVKINLDLMASKINLIIASSGEEALELVNKESYDCIISDFHLPDLDGLELLKILKEVEPSTPFILHVGEDHEKIRREANRIGADNYFTKSEVMNDYTKLSNAVIDLASRD